MPTTTDPQHLSLLLWASLAALTLVLAVLGWSLKGTLRGVLDSLEKLGAKLDAIVAQVSAHETSLASGNTLFRELQRRLDGVESRERDRCNRCRYEKQASE